MFNNKNKRKRIVFIIFGFLFISLSSHAQWARQVSGNGNLLISTFFINKDTGFIVGGIDAYHSGNTIMRTTNGGLNWETKINNSELLASVYFFNKTTGIAVGSKNLIVKTINCGSTWVTKNMGTIGNYLFSVHFPSSDIGYAIGGSIAMKSTNAGNNWATIPLTSGYYLSAVYFTSVDTGYAVGWNGVISKTTDGGINWYYNQYPTSCKFNSVYFPNDTVGYIVGGNLNEPYYCIILKTTDSGLNWKEQHCEFTYNLSSVYFINKDTGYIVGEFGIILHTTDGGENWEIQPSWVDLLRSVYFTDEKNGWAVGDNGVIIHTTNGGSGFFEDSENKSSIEIFPNPCRGELFLYNKEKVYNTFFVSLINIQGQVIYQQKIGFSINYKLNFRDIPNGMYVINITNDKQSVSKKIVIEG